MSSGPPPPPEDGSDGPYPTRSTSRVSHFYNEKGQPTTNQGVRRVEEKVENTQRNVEVVRQISRELSSGKRAASPKKKQMPPPSRGKRPEEGKDAHEVKRPEFLEQVMEHHEDAPVEIGEDGLMRSKGLSSELAEQLLKEFGRNEIEEKHTAKWKVFARQLYSPMAIMIWIAAAIEAGIQSWPDFAILVLIVLFNAGIAYHESMKAGDAIAALKATLKPKAVVKRDGRFITVDGTIVVPGDLVLLSSGCAVPADCIVNHGQVEVDQAALTGESLPVARFKGDSVKMGSTVVRGETEATVEATGVNTFFGKTAALLGGEQGRSNLKKMLLRIMIVLVTISLIVCGIAFVYMLVEGLDVKRALGFTVVLLVASIPLAMEMVCTTTLALGARQLAKEGAIVSRLAAIEDLAGMQVLCCDKTGTLTLNKMVIQEETPIYAQGETQYTLLRYAAMASKWRDPPKDALDTLVLGAADLESLEGVEQVTHMPFDPTVKRTEGTIVLPSGETFKVTKGAPHVILELVEDQPDIDEFVERVEADVTGFGERGVRCLAVAKSDDINNEEKSQWKFLGLLTFLDPPRADTKETIRRAHEYGIDVKMITGDHLLVAKETARQLSLVGPIDDPKQLPMLGKAKKPPKNLMEYLPIIERAAGFAQVFPEHKFLVVETLRRGGYKTGMTGDGVNDAPALKNADVGVAVQGATDAARAAADIVLTRPGLSAIIKGIVNARVIFGRMRTYICYRIAATLQLLSFFFIAIFAIRPNRYQPPVLEHRERPWPEFFQMPVLMLMLITVTNDGTLIAMGYDRVAPSNKPEKWNLPHLFTVACVLAAGSCSGSLLLLWLGLTSWQEDSILARMHLGGLWFSQITTMMFLNISLSWYCTLFSARCPSDFFWSTRPSVAILVAAAVALTIATVVANVWPWSLPDGIPTYGMALRPPRYLSAFVWAYSLVWWLLQDTLKVIVSRFLHRYVWVKEEEMPSVGRKEGDRYSDRV